MMTTQEKHKQFRIVDLFSGVGGLSLGAARAGFFVHGAVELDPQAMKAHKQNFPLTNHLEKDVTSLTGTSLRSIFGLSNGDLSGIVGGPPCQGFSLIGRNKKNDKRNELFVNFFRLIQEAQPKFFLAENVPGILGEQNQDILDRAFSQVKKDYKLLPPLKLSANDFGAPTTRTRVFFLGYKPNEMDELFANDFIPSSDSEQVLVSDALNGLPKKIKPSWQTEKQSWRVVKPSGKGSFQSRLQGHIPYGVGDPQAVERLRVQRRVSGFLGTIHSERVLNRYALIEQGKRDQISKSSRLDPNGFCPTLRAGTGSDRGSFQAVRPLHPTENRVIVPREAARLQGFPDWFQFSPTKWHSFRQIGNSVSPILSEQIFSTIIRALI